MNMVEMAFTELLSEIVDNRGRSCPTAEKGLPLIATNCIKNDGLYPIYETERYVDAETYEGWFRGHPEPGDILFVCKGSPGTVALVPDPVDFCIAQDMVAVRADPSKVYPNYLFAVLRAPQIRHQIYSMHVGSLIPHFKKGDFHKLRIPILSESDQRFIGDAYVELSRKIESNRRVWKMRLQIATATYESFRQSSTTFSSLKDLYEVGLSGVWGEEAPSEKSPAPTSCLRGKDLEEFLNGEAESSPTRYISNRQLESRTFVDGEIWTAGSGTLGPSLLITNASAKRWRHQLTYSNFVKRLVPTGTHLRHATAWQSVYRAWITDEFPAYRTGTAMPNLDADALLHGVQVPELSKMEDQKISELTTFALDAQPLIENDRLAALRDTLLPELLSGRIRVRDAKSIVEDAL